MCFCVFIRVCVCTVILRAWVVTLLDLELPVWLFVRHGLSGLDPHYNATNLMTSTQRWKLWLVQDSLSPSVRWEQISAQAVSALAVHQDLCVSVTLFSDFGSIQRGQLHYFPGAKKKKKVTFTPHSAILGWVQSTCVCYFSNKFWGIAAFKPQCEATLW